MDNQPLTLSSKDISKLQGNKRLDGEDFEKYKVRRKVESFITKLYLRGALVWDSSKKGTHMPHKLNHSLSIPK